MVEPLSRKPRRAKKNPKTLAIALPPIPRKGGDRLLDDERYWMTDRTLHLLAFRFVQLHGWKYAVIEEDEQVSILFLKMCAMVAAGAYDYERAKFSTLCWSTAFPRTLYREAQARTRLQLSSMAEGVDVEDRKACVGTMEGAELREQMKRVPRDCRRVLRMAFGIGYPELSTREIAILHRRTPQWVRARIEEGLAVLRVAYGDSTTEATSDDRPARKGNPEAGDGLPVARGCRADSD